MNILELSLNALMVPEITAYLVKQEFPPLLLPKAHLFHSHYALSGGVPGSVHGPCRSLANLCETRQNVSGVSRIYQQFHRCSKLCVAHLSPLSSVREVTTTYTSGVAAAGGLS